MKSYYLVVYDISDDKRRTKIMKRVKDFGDRIQLSVYECNIDEKSLERLRKRVERIIDSQSDSVMIISLCKSCKEKIMFIGNKSFIKDDDNSDDVIVI